MKKPSKKKESVKGRPPGAAGKKNGVARNEIAAGFRCSEGFNKVADMLIEEGFYKSRADVYHTSLQNLALKHSIEHEHYWFWISKI